MPVRCTVLRSLSVRSVSEDRTTAVHRVSTEDSQTQRAHCNGLGREQLQTKNQTRRQLIGARITRTVYGQKHNGLRLLDTLDVDGAFKTHFGEYIRV